MRQAGGERRGLAGAGAGEDQHRPSARQHRFALRRVQALRDRGVGIGLDGRGSSANR